MGKHVLILSIASVGWQSAKGTLLCQVPDGGCAGENNCLSNNLLVLSWAKHPVINQRVASHPSICVLVHLWVCLAKNKKMRSLTKENVHVGMGNIPAGCFAPPVSVSPPVTDELPKMLSCTSGLPCSTTSHPLWRHTGTASRWLATEKEDKKCHKSVCVDNNNMHYNIQYIYKNYYNFINLSTAEMNLPNMG